MTWTTWRRRAARAVAVALLCAAGAAAEDQPEPDPTMIEQNPDRTGEVDWPVLGIRVRGLLLQVEGTARAGEGRTDYVRGQRSNVRDDLEIRYGGWLDIRPTLMIGPDWRINANILYGEATSSMTVEEPFEFNGANFVPGEELDQELSLGFYGLELETRLWEDDRWTVWGGLGLALHSVNLKTVNQRPLAEHVDLNDGERVKSVVPFLHLEGEYRLSGEFALAGELRAAAFGVKGFNGEPGQARFAWLGLSARWTPVEWASLEAGFTWMWDWSRYRGPELSGTPDDNEFDLRFWGPSLAVTIRF